MCIKIICKLAGTIIRIYIIEFLESGNYERWDEMRILSTYLSLEGERESCKRPEYIYMNIHIPIYVDTYIHIQVRCITEMQRYFLNRKP